MLKSYIFLKKLNNSDLHMLGRFLIFLKKTGNDKAYDAVMHVAAEEMDRSIDARVKNHIRALHKSMFDNSQSSDPSSIGAFNGVLKSMGYSDKKDCK